jgi:hypothetical protein
MTYLLSYIYKHRFAMRPLPNPALCIFNDADYHQNLVLKGLGHEIEFKYFDKNVYFWVKMFTEIYWSLVEVVLGQYWRVLYSGFRVVSNNYYFSRIFSP